MYTLAVVQAECFPICIVLNNNCHNHTEDVNLSWVFVTMRLEAIEEGFQRFPFRRIKLRFASMETFLEKELALMGTVTFIPSRLRFAPMMGLTMKTVNSKTPKTRPYSDGMQPFFSAS